MSDVAPDDYSQEQAAPQSGFASGRSLGQRLAAEREARDWTIEYVAGQLNLASRQIQALENDNYAALPGIASVRGFVRAYAKLLKVDADSLVALIASEQIVPNQPLEPKPNLSSAPFSHSRLNGAPNRSSSLKGAALALAVVLLAAGVIGIEHMGGWPTLSQSLSNQFKDMTGGNSAPSAENHDASQETLPAKIPAESADSASASDGNQSGTQNESVKEPVKEIAAAASASVSVPAVANPVAPVAPAPAASSAPASAPAASMTQARNDTPAVPPKSPAPVSGSATLVLKARQNSWIDVRAGSNVIASHLLKAGDSENIEVPGAAQLTIGNAAGVDATFRGQALATTGDGKSNVAHINLK